ncbi:hypothetical protein FB566_3544 [Stackebrandtia endophytica]|uniref:Lipoprotein n=1 Tax=Stackebrandtia endophytica TaxID=1496996 RepID=A0A543AZH1_9ACTN|nr:hypothetical protein [Stackebrandtia endophytica]TQL77969.1 hypothetical protein FB566_3544 [Stackebrandtia endophytica]
MTQRTPHVNSIGRFIRCLVGTALAIAVVGGCSTGDPGVDPTDTGTSEEPAGNGSGTDPGDESSDGAVLELVESAVTVTEDSTGPMASYAVVVSNPSVDIALYTKLEIQLLDGGGDPVVDLDADREVVNRDAHLIMPGQTQVISNLTYIESDAVETIDVVLHGTKWAAADDRRFLPLTVDGVSAQADGDGAVVTFTVDSPYGEKLPTVSTYAIFRDSSGTLLGGSAPIDADPLSYVPGANDAVIEVSTGVPPEWDPGSTEVFVDPFVG